MVQVILDHALGPAPGTPEFDEALSALRFPIALRQPFTDTGFQLARLEGYSTRFLLAESVGPAQVDLIRGIQRVENLVPANSQCRSVLTVAASFFGAAAEAARSACGSVHRNERFLHAPSAVPVVEVADPAAAFEPRTYAHSIERVESLAHFWLQLAFEVRHRVSFHSGRTDLAPPQEIEDFAALTEWNACYLKAVDERIRWQPSESVAAASRSLLHLLSERGASLGMREVTTSAWCRGASGFLKFAARSREPLSPAASDGELFVRSLKDNFLLTYERYLWHREFERRSPLGSSAHRGIVELANALELGIDSAHLRGARWRGAQLPIVREICRDSENVRTTIIRGFLASLADREGLIPQRSEEEMMWERYLRGESYDTWPGRTVTGRFLSDPVESAQEFLFSLAEKGASPERLTVVRGVLRDFIARVGERTENGVVGQNLWSLENPAGPPERGGFLKEAWLASTRTTRSSQRRAASHFDRIIRFLEYFYGMSWDEEHERRSLGNLTFKGNTSGGASLGDPSSLVVNLITDAARWYPSFISHAREHDLAPSKVSSIALQLVRWTNRRFPDLSHYHPPERRGGSREIVTAMEVARKLAHDLQDFEVARFLSQGATAGRRFEARLERSRERIVECSRGVSMEDRGGEWTRTVIHSLRKLHKHLCAADIADEGWVSLRRGLNRWLRSVEEVDLDRLNFDGALQIKSAAAAAREFLRYMRISGASSIRLADERDTDGARASA